MAKSKKVTIEFKDGSQRKEDAKKADSLVKQFPNNWKIVEDPRVGEPKKERKKEE